MLVFLYGALTQSHLPSRCLRSPQVSLSAVESGPRPPKMTIMPLALPVLHTLAECYTRLHGPSPEQSSRDHVNGARSTFRHHTSLTGSLPVLPPKTSRCGLEYTITCPYRRPGVEPTIGTIIQDALSSPLRRSSSYRSSEANDPPPVAPPYTTICSNSSAHEACAARGEGATPTVSSFFHECYCVSNNYASPVMEYRPVSPIAPPNNTTLVLLI